MPDIVLIELKTNLANTDENNRLVTTSAKKLLCIKVFFLISKTEHMD